MQQSNAPGVLGHHAGGLLHVNPANVPSDPRAPMPGTGIPAELSELLAQKKSTQIGVLIGITIQYRMIRLRCNRKELDFEHSSKSQKVCSVGRGHQIPRETRQRTGVGTCGCVSSLQPRKTWDFHNALSSNKRRV